VASRRPPRGLPPGAPGASMASSAGGGAGCCPRGTGWSGCARPTGCHPVPACNIRDRCGEAGGEAPDRESDVCSRQTAGQGPRPKSLPIYISWYINGYGRPWTSSDVNPRISPVHGRIAGSCGLLPVTTEQKTFVAVLGLSDGRTHGFIAVSGCARAAVWLGSAGLDKMPHDAPACKTCECRR
jgi:hypothetical protein